MKFRDFQLPNNPSKIEIISDTNVHTASSQRSSIVENVSINPIRVRCTGELFGNEGKEACRLLQYLLRQQASGWLFAPELSPIKAYLTSFSYKRGTDSGSIAYVLEFTECCDRSRATATLEYTVCRQGENLFDIADRCGVAVERLVELNRLAGPFDINEGEQVMLL